MTSGLNDAIQVATRFGSYTPSVPYPPWWMFHCRTRSVVPEDVVVVLEELLELDVLDTGAGAVGCVSALVLVRERILVSFCCEPGDDVK
jgi:hypothetical protein